MRLPPWSRPGWCFVVALFGMLAVNGRAAAQSAEGDLPVRDSGVGYIDSAIPGNMLRFRYEDDFDNTQPSRGEFFWARPAPGGPGVPFPERNVDDQEMMGYVEALLACNWSVFAEVPWRMVNPEVNADASGFGDVNFGTKVAVIRNEDLTLSLQFRVYAPTGDPHLGLGNGHVSLEPAVLWYAPLAEGLTMEGELRYWMPVADAGFGSDVVRYGIGLEYLLWQNGHIQVKPVLEAVGWTFLNGKDPIVEPSGETVVQNAAGQTIFNLKFGLRIGLSERIDIYGGYAQPITGDQFFANTFRFEVRYAF